MGTHPMEMAVASGLGRLSFVKTEVRSAGISVRLATGTRMVMPGNSTDPLGKGSIGRVWDLLWPMFSKARQRPAEFGYKMRIRIGRVVGNVSKNGGE